MTEIQRSEGHSYVSTQVSGNARLHQGDLIINHYYGRPVVSKNKYEFLRDSLAFERMDARIRNVSSALPSTCEWLFSHDAFTAWTDPNKTTEHHGFLWIKGKPGSGKSTIMRKAVELTKSKCSGQLVLSYFFNARATGTLEKSILGLYRQLVFNILHECPDIRAAFESDFTSKEKGGVVDDWTEIELQNFLFLCFNFGVLPSLTIFIDALDEGEEAEIRRMIAFLEDIARVGLQAQATYRICLSSRHYPHISISTGLEIVVEAQAEHDEDISKYISFKLQRAGSDYMRDIRARLLQKSSGIFLWVVLVVPIINRLIDRGRPPETMLQHLDTIPESLHDLFTAILARNEQDLEECVALLQWVLYTQRPLEPLDLYCAIQQALSLPVSPHIANDPENIRRYILDVSRGLVEEVGTANNIYVQFIHETVRGFLMTTTSTLSEGGHARSFKLTDCNFSPQYCHVEIAVVCLQNLLQPKLEPSRFDFMGSYAAHYWWLHAHAAGTACDPRIFKLALELLTERPEQLFRSQLVKNLDSAGDDYLPKARINSDDEELIRSPADIRSPLYYAALIGIPEVLTHLIRNKAPINKHEGTYGSALQAAAVYGHKIAVEMLLDAGARVNDRCGRHGTALSAACAANHETVVNVLLSRGADMNANNENEEHPFVIAALHGGVQATRAFLQHQASVRIPAQVLKRTMMLTRKGDVQLLIEGFLQHKFPDERMIRVRVHAMTGGAHQTTVWDDTKGIDVKYFVRSRTGASVESQYLVIRDRFFSEQSIIGDRKVKDGARIDALLPIWQFRWHDR